MSRGCTSSRDCSYLHECLTSPAVPGSHFSSQATGFQGKLTLQKRVHSLLQSDVRRGPGLGGLHTRSEIVGWKNRWAIKAAAVAAEGPPRHGVVTSGSPEVDGVRLQRIRRSSMQRLCIAQLTINRTEKAQPARKVSCGYARSKNEEPQSSILGFLSLFKMHGGNQWNII